jgi:outer membrane protein, adhesin transport system
MTIMRRFPLLASLGIAALAGCTTQTATMGEMSAAIDNDLVQGPAGQSDIDRRPVDLGASFPDALRAAVESHDGYRAALALEAKASASIGVAKSDRRTQVTANARLGAVREGDPVSETTAGVSGDLALSQLLYDGGASLGSVNRATAEALVAQADRVDRGNVIALEAAQAWADMWLGLQRLALLRAKTRDLDELQHQMDRMAANGLLDRASMDAARRQLLDIQLQKTGLELAASEAELRFARYFGTVPASLSLPSGFITATTLRSKADEWKTAPYLRRLGAGLLAARSAEVEARAAFKPVVRVEAGVSSPLDDNDTTDVAAGVRLSYAFNDGGRRKAQLEAATLRVQALEAELRDAQRIAGMESESALARLAAIDRSLALVAEKIALSASAADTAKSQIATGQTDLRNLVAAQIEHYRACDEELQMQAQRFVLLATLAARTGLLGGLIGLKG